MNRAPTESSLFVVTVCAFALLGAACADREHIRDDYGQRVRTFPAMQRVYAQAAVGTPTGLDSEESAVIHKSYRAGLSGKAGGGGAREGSRVLILGDAANERRQP